MENKATKKSIRFYKDHEVRAVWDDYLKAELRKENGELVSATTQLKFRAADEKLYNTMMSRRVEHEGV